MLRPRKHPLIDQPLVATAAVTLQRLQWGLRAAALAALVLVCAWLWRGAGDGDGNHTEAWWRTLIVKLIHLQFQDSISQAKDGRLSERMKTLEVERTEMQARLEALDKLVQSAKVGGWLRQLSVLRDTNDEISYEILLTNPHPNVDSAAGGTQQSPNIVVTVRGIDRFDVAVPETGVAQSVLRFKTVKHELAAPRVAETIRGTVSSKAAKFLIATAIPFDNPTLAEVRIIPVGTPSQSP